MLTAALVFSFVTGVPAVIPTTSVRPPLASLSAKCRSADCVGPWQVVTADEGVRMKRELGERALLVDIRARGAAVRGMLFPSDMQVPFVRREAPVEFEAYFANTVDEGLRARHLAHNSTVIVYAGTRELGVLAALLLQEHGYSQVFVVA